MKLCNNNIVYLLTLIQLFAFLCYGTLQIVLCVIHNICMVTQIVYNIHMNHKDKDVIFIKETERIYIILDVLIFLYNKF